MVTTITDPANGNKLVNGNAYLYDQLNRLTDVYRQDKVYQN